ncbi:uracil-DNA glycosylase [Emcibacter sp. SYSU 3D8]|uniref:uracil-DNA glycosylase n=1 Tax=Emcibacter sp. SYSU 3D8 TaxID=3133969 RepID=UPI0031FF10C2
MSTGAAASPSRDCPICPRLVDLRLSLREQHPDWFNAPVPSFGDPAARLVIVGLAPGLNGANRTGRPFTGDYAGDLLYGTLIALGLAKGEYRADPQDGLMLEDCLITNAVRCLPPANKPQPDEIKACRPFLTGQIDAVPTARALVALGRIAHESVVRSFGGRMKDYPFGHGTPHLLPGGLRLFDSYHCSRYNTNTGRLTEAMFVDVMTAARDFAQA